MDEDTEFFLSELEKKHGGELTWRTFSTWYGCSDGIQRQFGVFLFKVFDTFHFEDFEKKSTMFGIAIGNNSGKRKNKKQFIKMERSFAKDDIIDIKTTTRSIANTVIRTGNTIPIKAAGGFDKVFRKLVTAVTLKDGTIHFFELIAPKEFVEESK
jgi:hypothetical protein